MQIDLVWNVFMLKNDEMKPNVEGGRDGAWTRETFETLYSKNFNKGLGRFISSFIAPKDMLEFGSGVCELANFVAERTTLGDSYLIEPKINVPVIGNLNLLNINIFEGPTPKVLNRRFDLVLSIEVAEHIPIEHHEALFDFLVGRAERWIVFSGGRPGQGGGRPCG